MACNSVAVGLIFIFSFRPPPPYARFHISEISKIARESPPNLQISFSNLVAIIFHYWLMTIEKDSTNSSIRIRCMHYGWPCKKMVIYSFRFEVGFNLSSKLLECTYIIVWYIEECSYWPSYKLFAWRVLLFWSHFRPSL